MAIANSAPPAGISSGIAGLDDILRGGITPNRMYLVEGDPGAGKTTLALQFLIAGAAAGERCLYVTLSETKEEVEAVAESHGWDLTGIDIFEMATNDRTLAPDGELTMFHPSEVELGEATQRMLDAIERVKPSRLVVDSLSELRLVSQNALRYRRQVLAFKHFFSTIDVTALMLDDRTGSANEDGQLQSIAHGVIVLEQLATEFGSERRRLRVTKFRGRAYRGGFHDFLIRTGGLDVFPRLIAAEHRERAEGGMIVSGVPAFDHLLGGGIPLGTSTLLIGPAGTGKSTLAAAFCVAAARAGQRSAAFVFDENIATYKLRSRGLRIGVEQAMAGGLMHAEQIDPAELSPGEFIARVRRAVEGDAATPGARLIVIDSLNGYLNAMPEEKFLTAQMHELLAYLGQMGVATLLTVTQSGMIGNAMKSPVDTTYLADNVVLFRYFEAFGDVRRAVSVVKKRSGPHERSIREMRVDGDHGIVIGEPLREFHGILSGTPTFRGDVRTLLTQGGDATRADAALPDVNPSPDEAIAPAAATAAAVSEIIRPDDKLKPPGEGGR